MDLNHLNPPQREAVQTTEGRLLVLAGAGSGKTRVLTVRAAYMIQQCGISPDQILGLTFTNKAAHEMRTRLAGLLSPELAKRVTLCTFHSFCMKILRNEIHRLGYTSQFTLYDQRDVERLVTMICRDLLDHDKGQLPSIGGTMALLSKMRNKSWKPDEATSTGLDYQDEFLGKLFLRLCDAMRAHNAVDFDGLLGLTVQLFVEHPDVLERYQDHFRYIMIDEYQDTNPIQYQLASLLSRKYGNLCVVGDDDQSIYGWRGAEVANILEFGNCKVVRLEQNYRSSHRILKAANAVISLNRARKEKTMWSDCGEGDLIEVFHAPTEQDEARAVISRMLQLRSEKGLDWKDMAILYRSNALSRQFEMELLRTPWPNGNRWMKGIPYQIFGGLEFYERREVKDLLAYLRVIVNPQDQEALLRVINYPRRGIGDQALDKLTDYNRKEKKMLWTVLEEEARGVQDFQLSSRAQSGVRDFMATLEEAKERFESQSLAESLSWLLERIRYQQAIHEEVKSAKMRAFKWENVQELVSALAQYEQEEESQGLLGFLSGFSLDGEGIGKGKKKRAGGDFVNLMTLHSSKGLEFPACFLVGLEDHIIPHEKSMKETGIEEERRLFYVGMTRCMRHLCCSMAQKRMRMGKMASSRPSRFLFEVPKEHLNVTRWDR